MSGRKTFNVTEGISSTSEPSLLDGIAAVVSMTGRALQAYQERKRQEREAALQREQQIQQKIAQIRTSIRSSSANSKIVVQQPQSTKSTSFHNATINASQTSTSDVINQALLQDAQRRVQNLQTKLPSIQAEYQVLIDEELLDASSVQQALQQTEKALQAQNLADAEKYLQVLDNARIQVIQQLQAEWKAQIDFVQTRLNNLQPRLPHRITQQLQGKINHTANNWQHISNTDIETLHQEINALESQAEEIQAAAENLVVSWQQSHYDARISEISDGDIVIEIETHEGANTLMRVEFEGQKIDLAGPQDRQGDLSCASRTVNVIQLFQEQGYQLEWTHWNGEPVNQEWRNLDTGATPTETATDSYLSDTPQRRLESQGY
ncbi:Chromosome segregation ATPase-like protein [Nostoc sp. DSM 114161]|jgi:hypothetical protein|uniref:hypothetical protein n=1 Tax=Nostoc sp. DSM 114161 TaxID=3440143 RepID=UPI004045F007